MQDGKKGFPVMLQFIYELYGPRTDIVGYVGITADPNERYKQHLSMSDGNLGKQSWISNMLVRGVQPGMRIREVIENDDERALEQEKYWIRFYLEQGINLTNIEYATKKTELPYEDISLDAPDAQNTALPLTDWQIAVWRIVYGDASDTGKKGQRAKVTVGQLHNLFEINNLLGNVQGATVREQLVSLHAMLLNTPHVQFIKRSQRFLYQPESPVNPISARDLMATVFPVGVQ
jgi:hypothetical protein